MSVFGVPLPVVTRNKNIEPEKCMNTFRVLCFGRLGKLLSYGYFTGMMRNEYS